MSTNKSGFTLIELLTVISIIGVLVATALPVYAMMQKNAELGATVDEIAGALQLARSNAVTAKDGADWGVHFDPALNTYTIYSGNWAAPLSTEIFPVDTSIQLPAATILFDRLTGATVPTTLTFMGHDKQEQVTILAAGSISN